MKWLLYHFFATSNNEHLRKQEIHTVTQHVQHNSVTPTKYVQANIITEQHSGTADV